MELTEIIRILFNDVRRKITFTKKFDEEYFYSQAKILLSSDSRKVSSSDSIESITELSFALQEFQNGTIIRNFGEKFLIHYIKQKNATTSDVNEIVSPDLKRYSLGLDIKLDKKPYRGRNFRKTYLDGRFNFCMLYDRQLIAVLGFNTKENTVFIEQIQGAKIKGRRKQNYLENLYWEQALIDYATKWTRKYSIENISIVSAQNNIHADNNPFREYHYFVMRYDRIAKKLGFKKSPDGNYLKVVG